jgi:hypothetical protein
LTGLSLGPQDDIASSSKPLFKFAFNDRQEPVSLEEAQFVSDEPKKGEKPLLSAEKERLLREAKRQEEISRDLNLLDEVNDDIDVVAPTAAHRKEQA